MIDPVIPPRAPTSERTDEQHELMYRLYIIEGLSGAVTAERMNVIFPDLSETRMSVTGYSARNHWPKGGREEGHGRIPPPEAPASVKRPQHPAGDRSAVLADLDPRDMDGRLLGEPQCRWPVGPSPRGRMALQLFCGEASHGDSVYCLTHCGVAYPAQKGT